MSARKPGPLEVDEMPAFHYVDCQHCHRPAPYPCSSFDATRRGLWSCVPTHPSRIKAAASVRLAQKEREKP